MKQLTQCELQAVAGGRISVSEMFASGASGALSVGGFGAGAGGFVGGPVGAIGFGIAGLGIGFVFGLTHYAFSH